MSKILIVFDSDTGKNEALALKCKSQFEAQQAEVRICRVRPLVEEFHVKGIDLKADIPTVSKEDLYWADAYIFTCPIHTGTMTASMKFFFDQFHGLAAEGAFLNKPVTAMTVGKFAHAGAETTIQQLYTILMQWGTLIVSTSIAVPEVMHIDANPYGLSFVLDEKDSFGDEKLLEEVLTAHAKRFVRIVDVAKVLQSDVNSNNGSHLPYSIVNALE